MGYWIVNIYGNRAAHHVVDVEGSWIIDIERDCAHLHPRLIGTGQS